MTLSASHDRPPSSGRCSAEGGAPRSAGLAGRSSCVVRAGRDLPHPPPALRPDDGGLSRHWRDDERAARAASPSPARRDLADARIDLAGRSIHQPGLCTNLADHHADMTSRRIDRPDPCAHLAYPCVDLTDGHIDEPRRRGSHAHGCVALPGRCIDEPGRRGSHADGCVALPGRCIDQPRRCTLLADLRIAQPGRRTDLSGRHGPPPRRCVFQPGRHTGVRRRYDFSQIVPSFDPPIARRGGKQMAAEAQRTQRSGMAGLPRALLLLVALALAWGCDTPPVFSVPSGPPRAIALDVRLPVDVLGTWTVDGFSQTLRLELAKYNIKVVDRRSRPGVVALIDSRSPDLSRVARDRCRCRPRRQDDAAGSHRPNGHLDDDLRRGRPVGGHAHRAVDMGDALGYAGPAGSPFNSKW